jgi:hypothetical protein
VSATVVVEVRASHSPLVSRPDELAGLLVDAHRNA